MPTRCFWPPESWRGMRSAKARGSFTKSSNLSIRSRRSASLSPMSNTSSARIIWRPTDMEGLSVSKGFWKTICTSATVLEPRFSMGMLPISLPSSSIVPSVAVSRPMSTFAKVDLPQPDSPTMANVSLSRASKLRVSFALTTRVSPPPKRAFAATS